MGCASDLQCVDCSGTWFLLGCSGRNVQALGARGEGHGKSFGVRENVWNRLRGAKTICDLLAGI